MTDTFRNHTRSLTSPPEHALAILPDDAAELPRPVSPAQARPRPVER